ncbi:MAG: methyl-accepting chemotaxis protein [Candidatus Kariarchaeaceae archaeon]
MSVKKSRGSFFGNLLAFTIIGSLFLVQSFISINSINDLESSYITSQDINSINERSRLIVGFHRFEGVQYSKRVIGTESHNNLETGYLAIKSTTLNSYDLVQGNLTKIGKSVSVDEGLEIFDEIELERDAYYSELEVLFSYPTLTMLNNLEKQVLTIQSTINKLYQLFLTAEFTNDTEQRLLLSSEFDEIAIYDQSVPNPNTIGNQINVLDSIYNNSLYNLNEINQNSYNIKSNYQNQIGDTATELIFILRNTIKFTLNSLNNITELTPAQYDIIAVAMIDVQDWYLNFQTIISNYLAHITIERTTISDLFATVDGRFEVLSKLWSRLNTWGFDLINEFTRDFSQNVNLIFQIVLLMIVLGAIFVIIVLFLINFQIARPIKSITRWSERISEGDLSKTRRTINRQDEVGVLHSNFKEMNERLRQIISDVKNTSTVVSTTAEDLSSNSEEINATAEEVSAIAQSMAKGSLHQAELITSIVEELQVTSEIVNNVISQINHNLVQVRELSEQTNVLALNTAIEAANAGEFGRGFTIIAENIRKMSTESKVTTEKVTGDSKEILEKLRTTFQTITEKIETVASVSEETAASAEEVAASAQEMTATMENVAATSQILNDQSSQSLKIVAKFVL